MPAELMLLLRTSADKKGIPSLNKLEWKNLNEKYEKETIISALIDYIQIFKPDPPILTITEQEMIKSFYTLQKQSYEKFYLAQKDVENRVMEKYTDYKYPFKKYGLGVIQMGNKHLDLSNYFNQTLRMQCDTYGFRSAHYRWKNVEDLRTVMLALWRLGNDQLCERSFVVAFRIATYIATQFKPHVAKSIYDMTNSKVIFDSSCGWGDRLAGFFTSNATEYYGCDPNPETLEMYYEQCFTYMELLGENCSKEKGPGYIRFQGNKKSVSIFRIAAEDFNYDIIKGRVDCAFTSPPYFSTELYNKGGLHENDQSWSRYQTYEDWRDKFFLPVNEKTFESLKDGGIQIVNIQDPTVNKKRYTASDELIDHMTNKYSSVTFLGNLGMRIMQRPKNVSKTKLQTHFSKIYIEPCWCFGKNRKTLVLPKNGGLSQYM